MGVIHVYSSYTPSSQDEKRRNDAAMNTWRNSGFLLLPFKGEASSRDLGDKLDMPFIHDMADAALAKGSISVISNNDAVFDPDLPRQIRISCAEHGCYWAYRIPCAGGQTDGGIDLVAFTRGWWRATSKWFPDLLLGYRWWDNIMRRLMIYSGCQEQPRLYYHEPHIGIDRRNYSKGEAYNQWCARKWLYENGEQE